MEALLVVAVTVGVEDEVVISFGGSLPSLLWVTIQEDCMLCHL